MKTIKIILPVVLVVMLSISCKKNVLDISPQDKLADEAVWSDPKLIEAYHNELYNSQVHGFNVSMGYSKYTDETFNSLACCGGDLFKLNTYNPDNIGSLGANITPTIDFWASSNGFLYNWNIAYQYMRKINVFLDKMATTTVNLPNKARMVAEAKFLRAFLYFNLIERFGGVPIVDKVYQLGDQANFKRNTFEECVTFIAKDIMEAMPDLPAKYASTDANYGRATGDACKALLSRTYLYAASPLFSPSKDVQKWQKAADAAEALLNSGYDLYPDYQKLFEMKQGDVQNEVIYSRGFSATNGHNAPMDHLNRRFQANGGWWGSSGPTANLVDSYDMTNGEQPYLPDGTINPLSGYNPQNPWANRDPRLEASVIHDGSVFNPGATPNAPTAFEMWVSEDGSTFGYDSYKKTGDNPRTNTVLKKFMPSTGPINGSTPQVQQWPFFRIAEIYLNYAEAKFELGDEATARTYVNKVRHRAGVNLPDLPATLTGEALRQRIYNERRVELVFEMHRFFDVRRWGIATTTENAKIYGFDIIKNVTTGVKTYSNSVAGQNRYLPGLQKSAANCKRRVKA
ncbi:RagB/SusD family nutrient uptake outer membrane protein [Mucilaginibacter auburnensis]|uniref:Putative outer membrane starch-binding protein n=1 Tax=Mucilaginibacter auburnensis TaxID=1457233 RepID=A0A2H9VQK2_9SPHI|nr:RagB/SusD family nutrient uptake outer membrane protein [Mucilaginibacter auburnensis]PJJ83085.1 putative outer membrane starch-binding protein [Mucilaginibacter auburnensis]